MVSTPAFASTVPPGCCSTTQAANPFRNASCATTSPAGKGVTQARPPANQTLALHQIWFILSASAPVARVPSGKTLTVRILHPAATLPPLA